jgi:hypothetical protein
MCYSAEVSFLTWGFGMACAAFLYSKGVPVQSFLFPLVFVQMQLVEGLRWIQAVDESILAVAGKIVIYLQPAAALYEGGNTGLIAPYFIAQTLTETIFGGRTMQFKIAGDGHLRWDWLGNQWPLAMAPYWAGLTYGGYTLYPLPIFLLMAGILLYYAIGHRKYGTAGSLWCVAANLLWVYYLLR